jgi:L-serine dehydratase
MGSAGVIPSVLMYYLVIENHNAGEKKLNNSLVAGEIGSIFKKGSTISAAMGGCQQIGASPPWLPRHCAKYWATPEQVLMAAEHCMNILD